MMGLIILVTAVVSFSVTALLGHVLIPYLHKMKYGQTILDIGPKWHKNKQGTPTMGGFMFIIGITVSFIIGFVIYVLSDRDALSDSGRVNSLRAFSGLVMAAMFAGVGFIDDYIKVKKKQNKGLSAKQKLVMQILISALYLFLLDFFGVLDSSLWIPFVGNTELSYLYYPLMIFVIVGFTNAVNLTDGIDGLASSVTMVSAIAFMVAANYMYNHQALYLSVALAAGCMGFLVWNFHPAKVFMGDTGSMFLGGMVTALAFCIDSPLILLLFGTVYLFEAFSVILQVISFQTTGKRIFKMSPIHHHFEICGWSEVKIVSVFSLVALLFSVIGCVSIFTR